MPLPKIEFVPVIDMDEDSEDEIEVIPFSKPPPVVIDLLESDSGDSVEGQKKSKKKGKRKKSKKKVVECEDGSADEASHGQKDASVSLSANKQIEGVPKSAEGEIDICSGQVDELRVTSGGLPGSSNVASSSLSLSTNSSLEISALAQGTLLQMETPSSVFESCLANVAQSKNTDSSNIMTDAVMVGTSTQTSSKDKKTKTKERKPRGEPRARKISATQRTNEEIVNFLTTLGIEMEPSAFDSPNKRRRQAKKRPSAIVEENSMDLPSATNKVDGLGLPGQQNEVPDSGEGSIKTGAYVSVTEEITPSTSTSSKSSPRKGKKQRQAIVGDISDFDISINNGDLNSLKTSFQSNVVFPSSLPQENLDAGNFIATNSNEKLQSILTTATHNYDAIIDAVAKGCDVLNEGTKAIDSINAAKTDDERSSLKLPIEKRDSISILKTPIPAEQSTEPGSRVHVDSFEHSGINPKTKYQDNTKELNELVNVKETGSQKTKHAVDSPVAQASTSKRKIGKKGADIEDKRASPDKKRLKPNSSSTILKDSSNHHLSADPIVASTQIALPSETTVTKSADSNSSFPTTWTENMKDFYGTSRCEDLELEDVWETMSDSPRRWKASRDMMPPPKNKRRYVRCDNCKQMGHFSRECNEKWKQPCCHMCGQTGHTSDHRSRRPCPQAKCLNCGRDQNQYSQRCNGCLLRRDPRRCEICNVVGHDVSVCPDNWRPFHSITSQEEYDTATSFVQNHRRDKSHRSSSRDMLGEYKVKSSTYCCNCGKRGHSFYDWQHSRYNPYSRNKPFVIREIPSQILKTCTASASIPISYDARTGRTVVMSAEASDKPEIAVETIQVKITNDLAVGNLAPDFLQKRNQVAVGGSVGSENELTNKPDKGVILLSCKQHVKCSNKLKTNSNDVCLQSIVMTQAHVKLLKAQEDGLLKPLEEKHGVQISVIDEGNKLHIYGTNAKVADKDLYRFLWTKDRSDQPENFTNIQMSESNVKDCPEQQNEEIAPVYTVDDDDDCCVIVELPPEKSRTISAIAEYARAAKEAKIDSQDKDNQSGVIPAINVRIPDSSTSRLHGGDGYFVDDLPCPAMYTSFEHGEKSKGICRGTSSNSINARRVSDSNSKDTFWDYESPLSGLSLGEKEHQAWNNIIPRDAVRSEVGSKLEETVSTKSKSVISAEPAPLLKNLLVNHVETKQVSKPEDVNRFSCNAYIGSNPLPILSKSGNTQMLTAEPESDVEVIILDDDEDRKDIDEEKVTLLQSEWDLVTTETMKKDNEINLISSYFGVDLVVSKEMSCISIKNGSLDNRKLAKDNIVFWLECKSSNTVFSLLPFGYAVLTTPNHVKRSKKVRSGPKPSTHSKQRSFNKMPLKLKDVQQLSQKGRTPNKRSPKKPKCRSFTGSSDPHSNNPRASQSNPNTPSGTSKTKRSWRPGFNKINFGDVCTGDALPRNPPDFVPLSRSPLKQHKTTQKSPRPKFNSYHPRKPRYFQSL